MALDGGGAQDLFARLQAYLLREEHIFGRQIVQIAEAAGQKGPIVLNVIAFIALSIFLIADEPKPKILCCLITGPLIMINCCSALRTHNVEQTSQWLQCLCAVTLISSFDLMENAIPLYYLLKTMLLLALVLPPVDLNGWFYRSFTRPVVHLMNGIADRAVLMEANPRLLRQLNLDHEQVNRMNDEQIRALNELVQNLLRQALGEVDPVVPRPVQPAEAVVLAPAAAPLTAVAVPPQGPAPPLAEAAPPPAAPRTPPAAKSPRVAVRPAAH